MNCAVLPYVHRANIFLLLNPEEQFDDLSMLCVGLNALPESAGSQAKDVKIS